MTNIKFKRGNKENLPSSAPSGMPLWCEDSKELFIGTGDSLINIASSLLGNQSGGSQCITTTHGKFWDLGNGLKIQSLHFDTTGFQYSSTSTSMNITIPFDVEMPSTDYIAFWNYKASAYTYSISGFQSITIPATQSATLTAMKNAANYTIEKGKFTLTSKAESGISGMPGSISNISVILIGV